MKKTRFALKAFAGTLAATILVVGSMSAPAQAKNDTGWGGTVAPKNGPMQTMRDTGWGGV
ncbi:MAG TPA: hypothetical protein VFG63_03045 [Nocardioidaceae bacterium]|nr:hypothetical protein [Nocardioidaceae bacterium]